VGARLAAPDPLGIGAPVTRTLLESALMLDDYPRGRPSLRLSSYDYAQPGGYFVTICTLDRVCRFGQVAEGTLHLNSAGHMVHEVWENLPQRLAHISLDAFVVMPNHLQWPVLPPRSSVLSERPVQLNVCGRGWHLLGRANHRKRLLRYALLLLIDREVLRRRRSTLPRRHSRLLPWIYLPIRYMLQARLTDLSVRHDMLLWRIVLRCFWPLSRRLLPLRHNLPERPMRHHELHPARLRLPRSSRYPRLLPPV
jgi:REP element-mobilizing transposase RayT